MHIYTAAGVSLLVSQIAFPAGSSSAVVQVNSSAANGYTKGMSGYTYNASDNVFRDGTSSEMGAITGSVDAGVAIALTVAVAAPVTTSIKAEETASQFQIRQNFPNPATTYTRIPVVLPAAADVKLTVTDMMGRRLSTNTFGTLAPGEQILDLDLIAIPAGQYLYSVKVTNTRGTYTQSRLMTKR